MIKGNLIAVIVVAMIVLASTFIVLRDSGEEDPFQTEEQGVSGDYTLPDKGGLICKGNRSGTVKITIDVRNSTTIDYEFLTNKNGSTSAVVMFYRSGEIPIEWSDDLGCYLFYSLEEWLYHKSDLIAVSGEDYGKLYGELQLENATYTLLITADTPGWGIRLSHGGGIDKILNLDPTPQTTGGTELYDEQLIQEPLSSTTKFSYRREVPTQGIFFRLISCIDPPEQITIEQVSLSFKVITPDNEIFDEGETGGPNVQKGGGDSAMFWIILEVVDASPGEWRFEGEYAQEGWNREWDVIMKETFIVW